MKNDKRNKQYIARAVAERSLPGNNCSGDLYLVEPFPNGYLASVIDGLGHGEEAANASKAAIDILRHNASQSLLTLINLCHKALLKTRGAVMSLASFDIKGNTMTWIGVGNVEGLLLRKEYNTEKLLVKLTRESLLLRSGVVGYRLPTIRTATISICPGDTLIFFTDGIKGGFIEEIDINSNLQNIADNIITHYFKGTDDALVLVIRWRADEV